MYRYRAYGLELLANTVIPGLATANANRDRPVDVKIRLADWPTDFDTPDPPDWADDWYTSAPINPNLQAWRLSEDIYWFRYRDGAEFLLQKQGQVVWGRWYEPLTRADAATYLLGPILGFILRWRGVICLHASAVVVEDRAIAFVGQAGAGKSTTAAAFASRGYPVLTDDVLALQPGKSSFWVQPAYPALRLWSSAVIALFGAETALPRLVPTHPTWDKRYLDLTQPSYQFQTQPVPLACLYFLEPRQAQLPQGKITPMTAPAGAIALITNTYTNYLLNKSMRAAEFQHLGQLLQTVALRQLHPHSDPQNLPFLLQSILQDCQKLDQN
ncbi:MAG: hypothetical protein SAJ12_16560 [Jaaginema sp. PMC 1079.18]|nr:hypothetical protein [Jaaginema sp. PMC 1080.18]MEC4852598.1 hypothetical protein [Jaaginema sp. PMC 1079.18]MEC4868736.1 hypothetical protein [Jaaginema sp. PMC 1078.18]